MSILSLELAVFIATTLLLYHRMHPRWRGSWLLLASYCFYALFAWRFVALLILLTTATFWAARRIAGARTRVVRRLWLAGGIAANVGSVLVFRSLYPISPFAEPFAVAGLSFYTLQAISYLADVYTGKLQSAAGFVDVALYLAYFPKLLAGPLERAGPFFRQVAQPRIVDDAAVSVAATLIAVGVTRKVVIADPLRASLPAQAFSVPTELDPTALVLAILLFVVVLYNDFAGYTQVVRGLSMLFGIELSPNFGQPYFAHSFANFWNRWHMTLSLWLRDYVYLPLSRVLLRRNLGRWNVPNLILPPMVTMLVSGLWHGGTVHMLVWGALHGILLIGERLVWLWRPAAGRHSGVIRQGLSIAFVFTLGTVLFSFFRMEVAVAMQFWQRLLGGGWRYPSDPRPFALIGISLWLDWMEARHGDRETFSHWPRLARAVLLAAAVLWWLAMTQPAPPAPFIYRGF